MLGEEEKTSRCQPRLKFDIFRDVIFTLSTAHNDNVHWEAERREFSISRHISTPAMLQSTVAQMCKALNL